MNHFDCPKCGRDLRYPENYGGRKVTCRNCAFMFRLPLTDEQRAARSESAEPARAILGLNRGWVVALTFVGVLAFGMGVYYLEFYEPGLSARDRELPFGEQTFAVVHGASKDNPDELELTGSIGIVNGKVKLIHPGAVIVIGAKDGIRLGGRRWQYRQIVLVNSASKCVLAPPGLELRLRFPRTFFGHEYQPGTFTVPNDSKMPE